MGLFFSLVPVIHIFIGIGMITGRFATSGVESAGQSVGWIFIIFGAAAIALGIVFSICLALAGRFLGTRRHYIYCLVMAALSCPFMPFGTVLGVLTLIVLTRTTVKQLFEGLPPVPETA
ncbi:MAG: hypothetical protein V3U98_12555 [Acidobacteriota bacterium]